MGTKIVVEVLGGNVAVYSDRPAEVLVINHDEEPQDREEWEPARVDRERVETLYEDPQHRF